MWEEPTISVLLPRISFSTFCLCLELLTSPIGGFTYTEPPSHKFYNCSSHTHSPSIEKTDNCYYQTLGGGGRHT